MWKKLKIALIVFFLLQVAFSIEKPLPKQSAIETLSKPIHHSPAFVYNFPSSMEEPILQIREIEGFLYWAFLFLLACFKDCIDSLFLFRFYSLSQATYHYLRKQVQKSQCHPPTLC